MTQPDLAPPTVILDTNVVLDWLVFRNPMCAALAAAVVAGELRWVATPAMRDELAHVLARGHLDAWAPDLTSLWAHWCAIAPNCQHPRLPGRPAACAAATPTTRNSSTLQSPATPAGC